MPDAPPKVQEFNTIAGLIFAQLYQTFPIVEDIDRQGIARAIGVPGNDWSKHPLPSGRTLGDMLAYTIAWLNAEGYIRAAGAHPAERVTLTAKGLTAMNAIPSGLQEPLGTELRKAVDQTPSPNLSGIGDLIGGFFGSFTRA